MSLRVNKDNIFFILPESRYSVSERIDGHMDKDFTLFLSAKIFPELMPIETEQFLIARNGMHSGISAFVDSWNNPNIVFTYWSIKTNEDGTFERLPKQIYYQLSNKEVNEFNDFTMICENFEDRKIDCYVNKILVGTIKFNNDEKLLYKDAFYWFGCGSMIGPEEHRAIGEFEYNMCFVLNKNIKIEEVYDIVDNYATKYSHIVFNNLKKLNYDFPLRKHFAFFCDFNHYNRYKVWDISFSGNYPQFYIEHNIYF
jgi:hypothetical protein